MSTAPARKIHDIQTAEEASEQIASWTHTIEVLKGNIKKAELLGQADLAAQFHHDLGHARSIRTRLKQRHKDLRRVEHFRHVEEAQQAKAERMVYGTAHWRDTARHWLKTYAQHPPACAAAQGMPCDCGLDKLKA
jgi:hypothetical protein